MTRTIVRITGMHCASCKVLIEDVCRDALGVTSCSVDASTGDGAVEHDERFDFSAFAKEVSALGGYTVEKI